LYFDSTTNNLYVCSGSPSTWVTVGSGAGAGAFWAAVDPTDPKDIYNTNSGNVGIGTMSPQSALDIRNDFQTFYDSNYHGPTINLKPTIDDNFGFSAIRMFTDITGDDRTYVISAGSGASVPNSNFRLVEDRRGPGWNRNLDRLVITPNGNVGIGTGVRMTNAAFTGDPLGILHVIGKEDVADIVAFMPGPDTAAAGVPSLNVGIGTTTPQAKLHIGGTPGPTNGIMFPDGSLQTVAAGSRTAQATAVLDSCLSTTSPYQQIPNMSVTLNTGTKILIMFSAGFYQPSPNAQARLALCIDGGQVRYFLVNALPNNYVKDLSFQYLATGLTPGSHIVSMEWFVINNLKVCICGGSGGVPINARTLTVIGLD
jgi:hypothetical protein